jgi:hypothetical protein
MTEKKIIERVAFTIFLFSLIGGIYIIVNSWVHPQTLTLPLTHLLSWPREDNFGIACGIISFFSFLIWNIVRE